MRYRAIEIKKSGTPWRCNTGLLYLLQGMSKEEALKRAYEEEPLKPPFEWETHQVMGRVLNDEGEHIIMLRKPAMLSNGCGPTLPICIYQLNYDNNTLDYLDDNTGEFRHWPSNAPRWRYNMQDKAREAAYTWLMVYKHSSFGIPRDVARMIAAHVIDTKYENCWHDNSAREEEEVEEPDPKRIKR